MHTQLLFSLPQCLFREIVSEWIDCIDQIRLDSAVCSAGVRASFLDIVTSAQFVVKWSYELNPTTSNQLLEWAAKRHASVSSISLGPESNLGLLESYLRSSGGAILNVQVVGVRKSAERLFSLVSTYCTNMQSFSLHHTMVDTCVQNILHSCTSVRDLRLSFCVYANPFPTQDYAKLHTVIMNGCLSTDIAASVLQMAASVKFLVLHQCDFGDLTDVSPAVTRLAVTDTMLSDAHVVQVAQRCPNITHLSFDSADELTDAGIVYAAEHLQRLSSVDMSYSAVGDASLKALAQFRADTLTEIFIVQCYGVSMKTVNALLKKCVNVRSLGVHCGDGTEALQVPLLSQMTRLVLIYGGNRGVALVESIAITCAHLQHLSLYGVNYITPSTLDTVLVKCAQMTSLHLQFEGLEGDSFTFADLFRWRSIRPLLEVGEEPQLYNLLQQ